MAARSRVGRIAIKAINAAADTVAVVARGRLCDAREGEGANDQGCTGYCFHAHVSLLSDIWFAIAPGGRPRGRPSVNPSPALWQVPLAVAADRGVVEPRLLTVRARIGRVGFDSEVVVLAE